MQNTTGGLGGLFGAGRAKPYAKPKMNDAYGMMSPEEIKRRVREKEERRRRARLIRDQAGDTVEQIGGKLYGSGGTLLGTMETGPGGVSVLNTNKSDLAQAQAKSRNLTLDDIYYLLNKDQAATNVANNTKQDMLNQMKNVRNIPTSASDSNNQGSSQKSPEEKLFDGMMSIDGGVDDLFG